MQDLAERVQRVRLLLETLNDPYPTPHGALRSDSGPAASRYVPCETCKRSGWVRSRRRTEVLCLACDGVGWRRRRHDEAEWDTYLELPVSEAVQLPTEAPHKPRQAEIDDSAGYAWERLQQAYERRGSYRELRQRLSGLAERRPHRYRLIRVVLIDAEPIALSSREALELELGVVDLALRMRSVRVPPWLLEHDQAERRRDEVLALATAGLKAGEIAHRLGMTKDAVRRRLKHRKVVESAQGRNPLVAM